HEGQRVRAAIDPLVLVERLDEGQRRGDAFAVLGGQVRVQRQLRRISCSRNGYHIQLVMFPDSARTPAPRQSDPRAPKWEHAPLRPLRPRAPEARARASL